MGVGKTVYKGEVETGVFAWFCRREFAREEPDGARSFRKHASSLTSIASKLAATAAISTIDVSGVTAL
jgi:hypothetical protein